MSNIVTGSAQANAEQQAVQLALQQQVMNQVAPSAPPAPSSPISNNVEVALPLTPTVDPPTVPPPTAPQDIVMASSEQPKKKTWKKDRMQMLYMFYLALVLIGGLVWGVVAIYPNYNPVEMLSNLLNRFVSKYIFKRNINLYLNTIVYSLVAVSALILLIQRDVWLPFLGKSVLPSGLVPLKNPTTTDTVVTIQTRPNAKVAYWASLPVSKNNDDSDSDDSPDVMTAYGDFSNSGVVMADDSGVAQLSILAGTGYEVPSGRMIPRHVHYRIINENGMMGRIRTKRY